MAAWKNIEVTEENALQLAKDAATEFMAEKEKAKEKPELGAVCP